MSWWIILAVLSTASALAGTWSPCGLSMLSTFTPRAEAGRGRRYSVTVVWFIAGSTLGGAVLGSVGAAGAAGISALDLGNPVRFASVAGALAIGFFIDGRMIGPELPHHRRQVNETWLRQFRRWVTASGFGLQIGFGFATYIMTTGVYLIVISGAVSARPGLAIAAGTWFGLVRGAVVLATARMNEQQELWALHRWFDDHRTAAQSAMASILVGLAIGTAAAAVAR